MRLACHWYGGFVVAAGLLGQTPAPPETVKGQLLEWDGTPSSGELSIRTKTNNVYLFRFDDRTRFEQDGHKVSIRDVDKGERIEILPGQSVSLREKYAQLVRLLGGGIPPVPQSPALARRKQARSIGPLDDFINSRGSLTFAGVVTHISRDKLTLRTREGEKTIVIRQDTRYVSDGAAVDRSALQVNTSVFVRAGQTFDREVEAYQVMWGKILDTR